MREQFEKLPDVILALNQDGVYWSEHHQCYSHVEDGNSYFVGWLNGAWMMYQEQQKKIEVLIQSWRGLKIKGIAPEHRAYEDALNKCADELGKTLMGQEYNSLKGTDEFFDALQVKLGNQS